MKTLMSFLALLSLTSCYDTFTREGLGDLKDEAIVLWTLDGSHYHLQQWTIDGQGNVNGTGVFCVSKSTKFDHPYETPTDFSGTIQKNSIATVKTPSAHSDSGAIILLVAFAVGLAVAIGLLFRVGPMPSHL